jgi:hypothetical protein
MRLVIDDVVPGLKLLQLRVDQAVTHKACELILLAGGRLGVHARVGVRFIVSHA